MIPHKVPGKLWEVIGANISQILDKHFLRIVDHFSKLPITKCVDCLTAECLLAHCKSVFAEHDLPRKIMASVGTNFVPDKFKSFYHMLNIE